MLFIDPEKTDMTVYDTAPILAAWRDRSPSGLSDYDRAIYDEAERVLSRILADGMTDLEKERAVYAWVTWNVGYDWTQNDPLAETNRDSFTPYGGLVARKAVCLGVASTFELLMDCVTVVGASFNSEEDHAWNMVRLDGRWTCADPTWDMYDAGAGGMYAAGSPELEPEQWGPAYWKFFNVTSDYMAENDHQWDYASVPET